MKIFDVLKLRKEIKNLETSYFSAMEWYWSSVKDIVALRKVLTFYSDPANYENGKIAEDGGNKARLALMD